MKRPSFFLKRTLVQVLAALCTNPFVQNYTTGQVYKGDLKQICAPGLNCYSCPAAALSCPIGALQTAANNMRFDVSFYALGILFVVGALLGRFVCGFLCVFGLVQDLLYRIPVPKLSVPARLDRMMRKLKYAVLVLLVLVLPAVLVDDIGLSEPLFCEYVCPAGMIEAALPLLAAVEGLRASAGWQFVWKAALTIGVLGLAMSVYRPFCKYLCPLGALYGLFNRFSVLGLRIDRAACTGCGTCTRTCPMDVDVLADIDSAECIRCGACKASCPEGAIAWRVGHGGAASPSSKDRAAEEGAADAAAR